MSHDFAIARPIPTRRHVPLAYKTVRLDCGYRMEFAVEPDLVLEAQAVEKVPIHKAQLLTDLRASNFNSVVLKDGRHRMVL